MGHVAAFDVVAELLVFAVCGFKAKSALDLQNDGPRASTRRLSVHSLRCLGQWSPGHLRNQSGWHHYETTQRYRWQRRDLCFKIELIHSLLEPPFQIVCPPCSIFQEGNNPPITYLEREGTIIVSTDIEVAKEIVGRWNGSPTQTLADNDKYAAISRSNHRRDESHIAWFVDPIALRGDWASATLARRSRWPSCRRLAWMGCKASAAA